jgi:hypothetical protein
MFRRDDEKERIREILQCSRTQEVYINTIVGTPQYDSASREVAIVIRNDARETKMAT